MCRIAQCDDLGMRRRIMVSDWPIPAFTDHFAIAYHERADRYLAGVLRLLGELQCTRHERKVIRCVGRVGYSHSIVAGGLLEMS